MLELEENIFCIFPNYNVTIYVKYIQSYILIIFLGLTDKVINDEKFKSVTFYIYHCYRQM